MARHKTPFALTAALLVVTTAFGIVATVQATHERAARAVAVREADRAKAAANRAERIRVFLEELLMAADPRFSAGEMTVRDLLDEAERRVDADWSDDAGLEADLRMVLGRVYQRFGIWAKAAPHFRDALRIR